MCRCLLSAKLLISSVLSPRGDDGMLRMPLRLLLDEPGDALGYSVDFVVLKHHYVLPSDLSARSFA